MAWTIKKVSIVAGTLALITEFGANNAIVMGFIYAGASGVAAPVIVERVVAAHDAEEARLAADRLKIHAAHYGGHRSSSGSREAGDEDEVARRSDADAAESPDMPRRLGPMLVARRVFLNGYDGAPDRAQDVVDMLDKMLMDDRRAMPSFERHAVRNPSWAAEHINDLADLRDMDARLLKLREQMASN